MRSSPVQFHHPVRKTPFELNPSRFPTLPHIELVRRGPEDEVLGKAVEVVGQFVSHDSETVVIDIENIMKQALKHEPDPPPIPFLKPKPISAAAKSAFQVEAQVEAKPAVAVVKPDRARQAVQKEATSNRGVENDIFGIQEEPIIPSRPASQTVQEDQARGNDKGGVDLKKEVAKLGAGAAIDIGATALKEKVFPKVVVGSAVGAGGLLVGVEAESAAEMQHDANASSQRTSSGGRYSAQDNANFPSGGRQGSASDYYRGDRDRFSADTDR